MIQRIIMCPKNDFVDDVNLKLIQRIPRKDIVYISDDKARNASYQGDYVDYLNSLELKRLPQHILVLKVNYPVILLRNINHVEGLCNGTWLICKQLTPNLVGVVIATGKNVKVMIIPAMSVDTGTKYTTNVAYGEVLVKASLP
ncbi:hypothetical protein LIER_31219 [Lithospermum erythrorhizon]|uniref:DNA helicase Pif1-like 2B domain-containing protein n=1 Tax=Lithospermum erythrorhizon TaxID=34254 RepID=A0AAV3RTZ7_LITER